MIQIKTISRKKLAKIVFKICRSMKSNCRKYWYLLGCIWKRRLLRIREGKGRWRSKKMMIVNKRSNSTKKSWTRNKSTSALCKISNHFCTLTAYMKNSISSWEIWRGRIYSSIYLKSKYQNISTKYLKLCKRRQVSGIFSSYIILKVMRTLCLRKGSIARLAPLIMRSKIIKLNTFWRLSKIAIQSLPWPVWLVGNFRRKLMNIFKLIAIRIKSKIILKI